VFRVGETLKKEWLSVVSAAVEAKGITEKEYLAKSYS
jgi:hypothetical protein